MTTTTVNGEIFVRTPLEHHDPPTGTLGLPGLGKIASENLETFLDVKKSLQLMGLWMFFDGNDELFLEYLQKDGRVVFRGGSHATADQIKKALCDTLRAKWNIIKNY